ncbi:MAG TPA: GldG family protein [Burkholderiales bacterium]|nr:GldG family protein [Burkholderiales bacterium]
MRSFLKKHEALVYSAVGLAALFLILVAVNYLASFQSAKIDLTEGRVQTLSEGTKKILRGLDAPVKLKLYISRGEQAMPVQLRGFAQRVEDLAREFKSIAGAKLVIETYNPKPDSDDEDAAQLDGVEAQQLFSGEQFYLGLAVSQLDRKQAIPALSPQRERLLEYDLARAIARVASAERPVLGLMSALPVLGERFNPMTRQSSEPWVLANELKRDFNVKQVPLVAESIDPEIKVLLVIHPRDLPEATEYALDQFVLRGGKLIAFVDPYAYFDQQPSPMPGIGGGGTSSSLPKLFKAWGVEMNPGKVLADVVYASGAGQRYTPTVLTLNRTALNRDDVVTSQIETLLYAFGGAFDVKPAAGLTVTELVKSSPNSMLVDNIVATVSGDAAMKGFQPENKARPLALRLTGKFKTAFPEGKPKSDAKQDPKSDAKPEAGLKESASDNSVILVADVDMLNDGAAVDVQEVFGRRIVVPSNGNLALAQGMVEQFGAGDALLSLRSRAAAFRPLTVVRQMEADAQKQYFGRLKALEDERQKTMDKLQELQKARGASAKSALILTPEQQLEIENLKKKAAETQRELKEVRKTLRQDAEALVFWTKVANIALMPLLVVILGLAAFFFKRRRQAPA